MIFVKEDRITEFRQMKRLLDESSRKIIWKEGDYVINFYNITPDVSGDGDRERVSCIYYDKNNYCVSVVCDTALLRQTIGYIAGFSLDEFPESRKQSGYYHDLIETIWAMSDATDQIRDWLQSTNAQPV